MVIHGNKFGKNPGNWYGPQMACHLIKNCYNESVHNHLNIVISEQGMVYEDEILDETLLLIPLRIGIRKIEQRYYSDLRYFLKYYGSVGIIGGTPRHALYFVGSVKTPEGKETDKLIALDPHTVQDVDYYEMNTYSCREPKLIHMNEMDPNIAIGFYFRNEDDFKVLKTMVDCNKSDLITIQKTKSKVLKDELIEEFEII